MLANTRENRESALEMLRAGRLDAARAAYDALLAGAPDDPDLLGLMAVVELQRGAGGAAERLLSQALETEAPPRIQLRNLHNLGLVLEATGRGAEAHELAAASAPDWPDGLGVSEAERDAVLWLAGHLLRGGAAGRGLHLLTTAMPSLEGDGPALSLEGHLRLATDDVEGALGLLEQATRLRPTDLAPLAALCHAQRRAGNAAACRASGLQIARNWPVHADPEARADAPVVLVFNRTPTAVHQIPTTLRRLHHHANFPGEMEKSSRTPYRLLSCFADLPECLLPDARLAGLPRPDVIINNIASAEWAAEPGIAELIRQRADWFRVPLINAPEAVASTTRTGCAVLLDGIDGLVVPRIARYRPVSGRQDEIAADILDRIGLPAILRQSGAHQSAKSVLSDKHRTAVLVEDAASLREALAQFGWDDLYALEYVDLRRPDGHFRKVRAIAIEGEVIIAKPSIFREWMVAGSRNHAEGIAFFRQNPHLLAECNRIVRDPEGELGRAALGVLDEITERMPLEMFGVDFDVDREGRVVFFEAGSAMNFGLWLENEPEDVRVPPEPFDRVRAAMHRVILRHANRTRGQG